MKKIFIVTLLIFSFFGITQAENTTLTCETTTENSTINNTLNITKNLYEKREVNPDEEENDFLLVGYQNNKGEYYINTDFLVFLMFILWGSFFILYTFVLLSFKVWKLGQK